MKNAIILTGKLRTIKKTMNHLKKNVMSCANAQVFMCIQNDTQISNENWDSWFKEQIGDILISITWFDLNKYDFMTKQKNLLVEHIPVSYNWKYYLNNSGSIIEYQQLHIAYLKMCNYEYVNNFRYDYIIRLRTDSIFGKKIDFHWLYWTDEIIKERINKIKNELLNLNLEITQTNVLQYFMSTIISDDLISNIKEIITSPIQNETDILPLENEYNSYIHNGRYILTIRKNNLYIVKRIYFYLIPSICNIYGLLKSKHSDDFWFNSEGQFRDACYYSGLSIYDYNTSLEDKSVFQENEWNEENFFDSNHELKSDKMLYCVVRK